MAGTLTQEEADKLMSDWLGAMAESRRDRCVNVDYTALDDPDALRAIARRLPMARVRAHLTQSALTHRIRCGRTVIAALEKGTAKRITFAVLERLCKAIGVSVEWLTDREVIQ